MPKTGGFNRTIKFAVGIMDIIPSLLPNNILHSLRWNTSDT